jgi:hypothetical protein
MWRKVSDLNGKPLYVRHKEDGLAEADPSAARG